jgi:hypothetical protein
MRLCPWQSAYISVIRRRSRLPAGIGPTPSGSPQKIIRSRTREETT